jgi:hypothetical protein
MWPHPPNKFRVMTCPGMWTSNKMSIEKTSFQILIHLIVDWYQNITRNETFRKPLNQIQKAEILLEGERLFNTLQVLPGRPIEWEIYLARELRPLPAVFLLAPLRFAFAWWVTLPTFEQEGHSTIWMARNIHRSSNTHSVRGSSVAKELWFPSFLLK